ncbi:hypothetical protein B0H14DRAFT_3100750 [Mycena olivaceomarginata]|nr:hypothetical protein B0H14DRAFT_3100750 [Mycena olivaceomarginata]
MEETYGSEHGAYIWGRSVHNIRIERLWCDVTRGFGRKWSNFFHALELSCGLRPDLDAHIWLLHHLFLPGINQDATDWAQTWNEHKIRFDGERTRSPRDMFFFGMIQNGARGFDELQDGDDDVGDLDAYGIDWEELHDTDIMAHHAEHNSDHELDPHACDNPFSNETRGRTSFHMSSLDDVAALNAHLALNAHSQSRNMNSRRSVWIDALSFCRNLYDS